MNHNMTDRSVIVKKTPPKRISTVERRASILQAALAILERTDYHEVTMDQVAREARVAKGTPYLYFTTKEKLFTALAEDMRAKAFASWDAILADSPPGLAALRALVRNQLDFFQNHKGLFLQVLRGNLPTMCPGRDKGCTELIGRNIGAMERALKDAQRKGEIRKLDTRAAAVALFGIVRGFVFARIVDAEGGDLTRKMDHIWDIFLNGVRP